MNPPDAADTSRFRQRKSLLLQAKKEGIVIDTLNSELLKRFSLQGSNNDETKASQDQQQGQNVQNENQNQDSFLPTPLTSGKSRLPQPSGSNSRKPISTQSSVSGSSKISSIPRPNAASMARKNYMDRTRSSAAKVKSAIPSAPRSQAQSQGKGISKPLPPARSVGMGNKAMVQGRSAASQRYAPSSRGTLPANSTFIRRSLSFDSNAWAANSLMTPSFTPSSTLTKSPVGSLRRWGSQGNVSRDNTGLGFKLPGNKDTKVLNSMMHCVHGFLLDTGYQQLPANPTDLKNCSSQNYYNMVKHAGEFFVGAKFFGVKKEDIVSRILELSVTLQYPKAMSKSHLLCSNAPNSWPSCLTFLTWLCCRARAAYTEAPPKLEELSDDFSKIKMESMFTIYHAKNMGTLNSDLLDAEVLAFRNRVLDRFLGDSDLTVEELRGQRDEKLNELSTIKNTLDPTKEVLETLQNTKKKLQETLKKIDESKDRCERYKNVHTILSQQETLKREIKSQRREIENLKEEISSQPMDKQTELKVMADVHEIQQEILYLVDVNQKLLMKVEADRSILHEVESEFREAVSEFTVVETFNAHLCKLNINTSVSANPFAPDALDKWLTRVEPVRENIERKSQSLLESCRTDKKRIEGAMRRVLEDIKASDGQLKTKRAYSNLMGKRDAEKEREIKEAMANKQSEVEKLDRLTKCKQDDLDGSSQRLDMLKENLETLKQELAKIEDDNVQLNEIYEDHYSQFKLLEAKQIQKVQELQKEVIAKSDELLAKRAKLFSNKD